MKKTIMSLGITVSLTLLAGCTTISHHIGEHPSSEGWRKGTLTDVGIGPAFIENLPAECKKDKALLQSTSKFATVHYRYLDRPHWHATPVPSDFSLKPGDLVYINTRTCPAKIEKRHLPYEKHP